MSNSDPSVPPRQIEHYRWAGLDFMFDADGYPVLLEANRCSHMVWEYLELYGDAPFRLAAETLNSAGGPICLMWRRGDPFPDAVEDATWIARQLQPHLARPPHICNVEDNRDAREELLTREGRRIRPGSIFRWWYDLPWTFERSGVRVINPNSAWVVVRDKLACYQTLAGAQSFRVPRSFAVESPAEVSALLKQHEGLFAGGYVLKPRIGYGGHGVQVADRGESPCEFAGGYLLSERIIPPPRNGQFWDVRLFVIDGHYLGGILRTSPQAVTNIFQGGDARRLDDHTAAALERPALEAVQLLDAAAESIQRLPQPPDSPLTRVEY